MTDPDDPPRAAARPAGRKPDRAERLANELRANLRRRKDQARGRVATEAPESGARRDSEAGVPGDGTDT